MERLIKGDFLSRTKKPTPNLSDDVLLAPSLPYDLVLMIVARVPRLYHRNLSLVSKSFRSMVASPELYKVRSLLGVTESCVYVCLRFGLGSYKWYTLSSKSSGGYSLARVPMPDDDSLCAAPSYYSDLVAVGSDIYNVCSYIGSISRVSILDCKSHTWRKAPSMPVRLNKLSAEVLDGKIYVAGRYDHQDGSSKNLLHIFNTNTQTWDLPSDIPFSGSDWVRHTFIIDGKFHGINYFEQAFAFNSKQCGWDQVRQYPRLMGSIVHSGSHCKIDNVLYSVSKHGALRWYYTDETRWIDLKGLVGLPILPNPFAGRGSYVKLTGCDGGNIMVFWNRNNSTQLSQSDTIYCAEIALERRDGDCWGKLEWSDSVLSVPMYTKFVKVLSVTL